MISDPVEKRENEIDDAFNKSHLLDICYSQAMWTVLSVIEDYYLKIIFIDQIPDEQIYIHIDVLVNSLTYPLRSIFNNHKTLDKRIDYKLINDHYQWASDWIDDAKVYDNFYTIFSLSQKKKISLSVRGNKIETSDWKKRPHEYEAYNRLIRLDGIINEEKKLDLDAIEWELMQNVTYNETRFSLNLNPKLVKFLVNNYSITLDGRYALPDDWKTQYFSFGEFKKIFTTIQAILYGRFTARYILAMGGMKELGYSSSVWVIKRAELISRLQRYTDVDIHIIDKILSYLTFGGEGIRHPDIAIQPIIDLKNSSLALSPFMWINSNVERNLCVLLNQIDKDKALYSKLTQEKESILRNEIEQSVKTLAYDVEYGKIDDTDVDIAIIDRVNKVCVCFELKWFIEPAEIREIIQRSEELEKGVRQAEKIRQKFIDSDNKLINKVLNIDNKYNFYVAVGSKNWIGHFDVQSKDIPIIKIGHFIQKLKDLGSLKLTAEWLVNREYLPKEYVDYSICEIPLELNIFKSSWYGIKPGTF